MVKRPIRNLRCTKTTQTRFCDVIVDEDGVFLEQKKKDKKNQTQFERIPWDDVVYQVEIAKQVKAAEDGKVVNR